MNTSQPHDNLLVPGGFSAHLNTVPEPGVTLIAPVITLAQRTTIDAVTCDVYEDGPHSIRTRGNKLILDFAELNEFDDVEAVTRVTLREDGSVQRISFAFVDSLDDLVYADWEQSRGLRAAHIHRAANSM